MAVLVEDRVGEALPTVDPRENTILQWHEQRDLLAVASYCDASGGEVNFFTKKGGKSKVTYSSGRNARITSLSWNPVHPIVAVGWTNGVASVFDAQLNAETVIRSEESDEPIVSCLWNTEGTVLFVAHRVGEISLFQMDEKGEKIGPPKHDFSVGDEIACCCHKVTVRKIKTKPATVHDEVDGEADEEDKNLFAEVVRAKERTSLIIPTSKETDEITTIECSFIAATKKGNILIITPEGLWNKVYQIENVAKQVLFSTEKNLILVLTADMMFYQLSCPGDDVKSTEKLRVKLSGKGVYFEAVDVGDGLIAMSYGEKEIRLWDLVNEDNAIVKLLPEKGFDQGDFITTLSYSPRKDCITGATQSSKLATWKRRIAANDDTIDRQWRLQAAIATELPIMTICWSRVTNALAVNFGHSVTLFSEQSVLTHCNLPYSLMQTGQQSLTFVNLQADPPESQEIRLSIFPIGLYIAPKNFLLWNADEVFVYEINDSTSPVSFNFIFSFKCSPKDAAIGLQNIYTLENDKINVRTFQGTVKNVINFPEMEGDPVMMDINDRWMCAGTTNGFIRIFDISRKDITQPFNSKYVVESVPSFDRFALIKINRLGNRVSCTVYNTNGELDDRLFVWDGETDTLGYFSVATGATDVQIYEAEAEMSTTNDRRPKTAAARKIEKDKSRFRMPEHNPGRHAWDQRDPRFLVCEVNHTNAEIGPNYMMTMFVTSEHGIQIQDRISKPLKVDSLLTVAVPFMYFLKKSDSDEEDDVDIEISLSLLLLRRTLREFVSIDGSDAATTEAMLNFSFYLTIGQMDNAFKAIKFIKSESVWEHMAHMCVKTRRLDVAAVCLGNMGHARGARALRKAIRSGASVEEQVAVLALQLGLVEEAELLYATIGRYDLLNRLYQAQNKWRDAFEVAEKVDRIHLRNTCYGYAKYLEGIGNMDEAIKYYERSQTHQFEIPRMLFEDSQFLEEYLKRHRDPHLQKWWAQFLESTGEYEGAINYYNAASDYLSVVRILCYDKQVEAAAEVAVEKNDRAACYHLARYFEAHNQMARAVEFFTKAQAFSSAIRLAKHDMADQLANLSLLAGGSDLVEAAKYYEEMPGYADKAVMLYHKAGMIGRALDLAFKTDQFSALDLIAKELDENSDPRVLERAAEFFANNQQYKKSAQLLAYAKNYAEAIELCRRTNVPLTEDFAETISPTKEAVPSSSERNNLLEKIAECCLQQSNYHYAAKKFAQAGNKIQAMRALIKSGDTPKIILFANTARNKDIYRIAGNYLQTINWKEDTTIMKHIETFYSKAGAYDSLAGFYESCAEVELEEYHDYEKTAIALAESVRHLNRALEKNHEPYLEEKRNEIESRIRMIQDFLSIREIYENDPGEALRRLTALTEEPNAEAFLRIGDVYAVIIIHNAKRGNYKKAHQMIAQFQQRLPRIDITEYIVPEVLDKICDEVKAPRVTEKTNGYQRDDEDLEGTVEYSHALRKQIEQRSFYDALDGQ